MKAFVTTAAFAAAALIGSAALAQTQTTTTTDSDVRTKIKVRDDKLQFKVQDPGEFKVQGKVQDNGQVAQGKLKVQGDELGKTQVRIIDNPAQTKIQVQSKPPK